MCAAVDTCLGSLTLYPLEPWRCHRHSWVDMCLGIRVHMGVWEHEDPGARKESSAERPGTSCCQDFGGPGMKPGL